VGRAEEETGRGEIRALGLPGTTQGERGPRKGFKNDVCTSNPIRGKGERRIAPSRHGNIKSAAKVPLSEEGEASSKEGSGARVK